MSRRRILPETKLTHGVYVHISPDMYEQIWQCALEKDVSVSTVVRDAIEKFLRERSLC